LRKICEEHNLFLKDVVVVVHEENDIKMARSAGLAIAFNSTSKELEKYCNVIIKDKNLIEILPHIP
jgi:phosphoserine phosphatase